MARCSSWTQLIGRETNWLIIVNQSLLFFYIFVSIAPLWPHIRALNARTKEPISICPWDRVAITILLRDRLLNDDSNLWHTRCTAALRACIVFGSHRSVDAGLSLSLSPFEGIGYPFNWRVNVKPVVGVRDQCHETWINLDFYVRDSREANNRQFEGESGAKQTLLNL